MENKLKNAMFWSELSKSLIVNRKGIEDIKENAFIKERRLGELSANNGSPMKAKPIKDATI